MPKSNGPKLFAPRKIKGGSILGKDEQMWFAVRANNFSAGDSREFKRYFSDCCKEFFAEEEVPEDQAEVKIV